MSAYISNFIRLSGTQPVCLRRFFPKTNSYHFRKILCFITDQLDKNKIIIFNLAVLICCLMVTGIVHPSVHTDPDRDPGAVCTRLVEHIYHGHIRAVTPPVLNGLWTSQR